MKAILEKHYIVTLTEFEAVALLNILNIAAKTEEGTERDFATQLAAVLKTVRRNT